MLVKITHGDKATINTGNYENVNPMYSVSVEMEGEVTTEDIHQEIARIKQIVDKHLQDDINSIKNATPPSIRITEIDGEKFIHVTSALSPLPPDIPFIEEHAALGTCLDTYAKFIIDDLSEPLHVPSTPNVKTTWKDIKDAFDKWLEEYGEIVYFEDHSIKGLNSVHKYCGELDAVGLFDGKPAIFDFKKTAKVSEELREKYFMQMAAYAHFDHAEGFPPFPEALVIVSPFNKPIVTNDVKGCFEKFLTKLGETKGRYGL